MSTRTIAVLLTADSTSLRAQLLAAAREVDAFDKSVGKAGASVTSSSQLMAAAAKAGPIAFAIGLGVSVKAAADFEAAMRNVNSISGLSEAAFKAQGQAVIDLSRQLPQSAKTLAQGLYEIASSGFQGADGLTVLKQSAIAASAGLTTTQNSAKAITAVLNAYGLEAAGAAHVSDVLFQTVNLGVVNFEELTGVIGDTVGAAAAAGVSIEEVGAAVATMTLNGISASEAGTSLNRVLIELIKPGDELKAVLHTLGYESGLAAVQSLGLRGTMELLRKTTGGSADAVVALFKEVRGARGAFALMANEGQKYAEVTEGITHASDGAGASQKALNEQMKSLSLEWKVWVNGITAAAITGGNLLLPFLKDVLSGTRELARDALPGLRAGFEALQPFMHNVAEIGGDVVDIAEALVEAFGPLAAVLGGLAVGGTIEALNAISSVLADVTGILADHPAIVQAAAVAWASFFLATKGAAALAALPALLDRITIAMYDSAGAASASAASIGAMASTIAPIAIVGVAIIGLANASKEAKKEVEALKVGLDIKSPKGLDEWGQRLEELRGQVERFKLTSASAGANPLGALTDAFKNRKLGDDIKKAQEEINRATISYGENLNTVRNATGLSEEAVRKLAEELGVDLTQSFGKSGPARQQLIDHATGIAQKLNDVETNAYGAGRGLASIGKSVDEIKAASDAVDELASKAGDAFGKAFDLAGNYGKAQAENAQALEEVAGATDRVSSANDRLASAQEGAADSQQRVLDAQDKVVESEERVAELRTSLAEKAAEAQERYAERVEETDRAILRAEEDLAEKRISLAEDVADAERKLEEDRLEGQERIKAAEQRIRDVQKRSQDEARERSQRDADQRRLDAAKDPEARRRIQAEIDARKRREDEAKARADAAKDLKDAQDDLAKTRADAAKTEAKDREALADAQKSQARGIEDAEEAVTKARRDGVEVQKEGQQLAKQAVEDERSIASAVKDVESARRDVIKAQQDAGRAGADVAKAQGEVSKAYDELATAQKKVADTSLEGFFARTLREAQDFADGITEAARQGLNPSLIAQLLTDGPEKAAPLLRAIMADQNGLLVGMLNETESKLDKAKESVVEKARVMQRAINATGTDMAADFGKAMDILAVKAASGGKATAEAIAEKLGLGVERVRQIAKDYVIVLADGINPLLQAIGGTPVTIEQNEGTRYAGQQKYAEGGLMPGSGDTDSLHIMAMPGEYMTRKAVVAEQGVGAFDALNAGKADIVPRFAAGGFVSADSVPRPPDFGAYGTMLGRSGADSSNFIYEAVTAWVRDHPGKAKGGGGPGGYGFQALIDYLNGKGIENEVTSTTGGQHVEGSYHYRGLAADFVSAHMQQIFDAFSDIAPSMAELFYDPAGYSIKNGARADWTLGDHGDHVHAASWGGPGEGPGIPGTGGGSSGSGNGGAASGSLDDWINQGLDLAAKPASWHQGIYDRAMQESGGDPNAQNNWDSNAEAGTPSKGVMQMIDPTFEAYKVLGHDDIWNPVDNIASASNYIAARYGDPYSLPAGGYAAGGLVGGYDPRLAQLRSYDQGGWLPPGLTMAYNGTGRPEAVGGAGMTEFDYAKFGEATVAAFIRSGIKVVADGRQIGVVAAKAFEGMRRR